MTASLMRLHRPLGDIIRDMKRSSSPSRYDDLLTEWIEHPEVAAQQSVDDAIDRLLAEQDGELSG